MLRTLKNRNSFFRSVLEFLVYRNSIRGISLWIESLLVRCPKNDLDMKIIGGKLVSRKMLKKEHVVISAGIGSDLDFEMGLSRKLGNTVIGIDPTKVSLNFLTRISKVNSNLMQRFKFINKALTANGERLEFFSGDQDRMATTSKNHSIGNTNTFDFEGISLGDLIRNNNVGYLKLDIEGYEYQLFEALLNEFRIPQIAIEFHHFCVDELTAVDALEFINKMEEKGYTAYDFGSWAGRTRKLPRNVSLFKDNLVEILFVLESEKQFDEKSQVKL